MYFRDKNPHEDEEVISEEQPDPFNIDSIYRKSTDLIGEQDLVQIERASIM